MANRVFQNVVYQMKDAVDRVVGVVDETGTVISCSELGQIGEVREGVAAAHQTAGDAFVRDGYSYHQFSNAKHNDYAAFVEGTDETAEAPCVREPFPCCRLFAGAYYFFCFFVSIKCRIARTGWWKIIRGPLQRMTCRMASRIWGL